MATVTSQPGQHHNDPDHAAGVARVALKTAGGSAIGIGGILTASALEAIPMSLSVTALIIFGVIMIGALWVAAIYIRRR
ncbi:hypothetical protein [Actinoplanes aureus]|uniref:Uncharacterized protein n=1 Tax=Actinoplanes aureus TaxID=2792083 RepID=A0A931FVE7_9ACTN|nr:hypothetical protein [Actinoplanes aureus]MBG0560712.1 hypothetical protein [Actinoplanes aureus]